MKATLLIMSLVLFVFDFSGCAEKHYSHEKPDDREVQGSWALDRDSREKVERAFQLKLSDKGGAISVRSDGTFTATEFPKIGAKPKLLSGGGLWCLESRDGLEPNYPTWKLELVFVDPTIGSILVDIGHDAGKIYLNSAIDDPDGPAMRFFSRRVEFAIARCGEKWLSDARQHMQINLIPQRLAGLGLSGCFLLLCIALCSCGKPQLLPNEKRGKGDLASFTFSEIVKYGGTNVSAPLVTPSALADYVYSEDKDGFQVVCPGNQVAALCAMFQPHFGTPSLSTSNVSGLASFVYSVNQAGLAISCGLDSGTIDGVRKQMTQLVAVKPGALKPVDGAK
jgi:hypothetical protein